MNNWQVPEYKTHFFLGKNSTSCVIIPVINEGNRIKSLLNKMLECGVSLFADILIIDGGSTDSSLNREYLEEYKVKSLLEKTSNGKLSAQLRCAYSFALEKGYKEIITIDGNDKDDPTPIKSFIEALRSGYDFVQASRYIPGGIQENTPFIRDLAIRLIHAPILRVSSGFKWTDTTQGFRGYSSKILLDNRVAPFRDVFLNYELLAYLSYRVPQLGYKCVELPTSRIYPKGSVPTKINGLKGNLELLKVLFKTVKGHYNP